jgi:hypothetical protein
VFDHACKLGLERIVSKRLGGAYASGRCRNWLKGEEPRFRASMSAKPFLSAPPGALSADAALPQALHGTGFSPSPWGISVANS